MKKTKKATVRALGRLVARELSYEEFKKTAGQAGATGLICSFFPIFDAAP